MGENVRKITKKLFHGTIKQLIERKECNMLNIKNREGNIIANKDNSIMER